MTGIIHILRHHVSGGLKRICILLAITAIMALAAVFGNGFLFNLDSHAADSTNETALVPTKIPLASPEIINPLRGYYRWRGNEVINREVVPEKDDYERYTWRDIETSPGVYNFSTIDNWITQAASRGQKHWLAVRALRDTSGAYAGINVPDYMEPYGFWYDGDGNGVIDKSVDAFIPDWNHQYFLDRATALLNALGARYNNDNRVSLVEIRMYGLWGEWHMYGVDYSKAPTKDTPYCSRSICINNKPVNPDGSSATANGAATLRRIVDMHITAFPNKPLIMMVGQNNVTDAVQYALSKTTASSPGVMNPVGLRNDCLGLIEAGSTGKLYEHFRDMSNFPHWNQNTYTGNAAESLGVNRWKYAPLVTEYCSMAPGDKETYTGTNKPVFQVAQQQITDYHVGMIGNGNFKSVFSSYSAQEQSDAILAGKMAGYRFALTSLTLPTVIPSGSQFTVTSDWLNEGVAPAYENWDITLQIRNSAGSVVWEGKSALLLKGLLPTGTTPETVSDSFTMPAGVPPGTYTVFLIIKDPTDTRKPLALAISGRGADGAYQTGSVTISTPASTPSPTPSVVPGDANGDGMVDLNDFYIWVTGYTKLTTNKADGEFTADGKVNLMDFGIWRINF